MLTDASPWVAGLSSESGDDDRPPNRRAALNRVAEQYECMDEIECLQVLNVLQPEEQQKDDELFGQAVLSDSPGLLPIAGSVQLFSFTGSRDPLKQRAAIVSQRQRNKREARRRIRAALRLEENGWNGVEGQLKSGEIPELMEQGATLRNVPSAAVGLGFIDMDRLVTGSNTREWCSSLRMCQGPELSNLHWNIVRFCRANELTPEHIDIRRDALDHVKQAVYEIWPTAEVHLFGSTATGLALPSSDIDIAVMSIHSGPLPNPTKRSWLNPTTRSWLKVLSQNLRRHGQCRKILQVPFAKVPLLKVVFNSGIACDISFDVPNGVQGVPLTRQFMQHYEALRPLCLVLKFLLVQKGLNDLYTGGIGSFCLINMVVSHLQNLGVSGFGHDLGVLLLTFFVHFSTMHDYRTDVVCTRPGFCASKHVRGWVKVSSPELLSCEDPLDPTSDLARGSYRIRDVRNLFFQARTALVAHWYDEDVLSQVFDLSQPPVGSKQKKPPTTAEVTPVAKKKSKKRKKKMKKKRKPVTSGGDEEDAGPHKIQRLIAKSVEQRPSGPKGSKKKKKFVGAVDLHSTTLTFSLPV